MAQERHYVVMSLLFASRAALAPHDNSSTSRRGQHRCCFHVPSESPGGCVFNASTRCLFRAAMTRCVFCKAGGSTHSACFPTSRRCARPVQNALFAAGQWPRSLSGVENDYTALHLHEYVAHGVWQPPTRLCLWSRQVISGYRSQRSALLIVQCSVKGACLLLGLGHLAPVCDA